MKFENIGLLQILDNEAWVLVNLLGYLPVIQYELSPVISSWLRILSS